ncbi:efflux RND transporter periplasmic adaptor subunit [Derxia lacustris]|uniref:efflux RND transporter periplasmic adaptor subunit n=1 Tax=Derxia lacustris TaxID=764842 RepID=UPI000A16F5A4|nr:efflux RND transporter periplasmic adaptor subunit [Derxia lacustris]
MAIKKLTVRALLSSALTLGAAGAVTLLPGCGSSQAEAPPALPQAMPVTVAEVAHKSLNDWDEFTGRLDAVSTVDIHPRVGGFIDRVAFADGARVKKGQLLYAIDARPFRAEVARLSAERDRAAAQLALATSNHERAERLLAQNAIAKEEADRLATDRATAASAVAAATAALDAAKLNLEFSEVRSPIDGRISRAAITAGNLVTPDSLLTTVVADDRVYAYFDADEHTYLRYAGLAKHGEFRVQMGLVSEDGYPHEGKIDFIDNRVDPRTGTIRGRAVFDNAGGAFTPGLFARIRLVGNESRDTVLIEDRAVGTDLGRKFVFVLKDGDTVDYRAVTLGAAVDGLRVVKSGLAPGETIVVNGLQRVRPGAKVVPTKVAMKTDGRSVAQVTGTPVDGLKAAAEASRDAGPSASKGGDSVRLAARAN